LKQQQQTQIETESEQSHQHNMSNRLSGKKGTDDAWKSKDASPLSLLVDAAETQNLRTPQSGGTGNRLPSSNGLSGRGSVGSKSPNPPQTHSSNGNEYASGNGNPSSQAQGGPGGRSQQQASGRTPEGVGSSLSQLQNHSNGDQHNLMQRQAMSAALEASQMQQHGHFNSNGIMGRSGLSETERNMYHHALAAAQQQQQAQQHAAALSILRQASMQGGGGHQFGQFDDGLLVRAAAIAAQQQRFGGIGGGGGNNSSLVAAVIANNPHLGPHLQQEIDQIIRQQQEEELQRRQQLQQLHQRAGGGGDGGYPQQLQAARQLQLQQEAQLLREKDMMVHEAEQRERDLMNRIQGRAGSMGLGGVGSPSGPGGGRPSNGDVPSSLASAMGNNARPSSSGGAHPNESFKKVPGSVLVPCRARGMPMDHNFKTAYFVIPEEVEHGEELICSYYSCRNVGIKFRYCVHCKVPVAKRNFRKRHKHGMTNETDDEANEEDSDEGEYVDVVTSPQGAIPQHAASLGETSSSNLPTSIEDKPSPKASARPSLVSLEGTSVVGKGHASTKTTTSVSAPKASISTSNKSVSSSQKGASKPKEKAAAPSPENGKKNGCNKIDDVRVERWASLLVNRPPTSASSAMSNWLLEVLAVSDLDKPLKDIPTMSADANKVSPSTAATALKDSSNQANVTPVPPEDDDDSDDSDEEYDDSELDDQRPPVKGSPGSVMPSFASLKKYKRALPLGGASAAGRVAAAAAEKNEPEKKKHKKVRKEKMIERK